LATRAALLITVLLLGGCLKPADAPHVAGRQRGCRSCHAAHYVREGACHDCHRGDPGAERVELAHDRLLAGRAAEHRMPGGPALREGQRLVEALACRRCHAIGGEGNRLASDLDAVVWTREQAALEASIREPVENMPRFGLDRRQAESVVAYLLHAGSRDRAQDRYRVHFAREAAAGGAAPESAFEKSCGGCHRILSSSGPRGTGSAGPNLSGLFTAFYPRTAPDPATAKSPTTAAATGGAWSERALGDWLRNPRAARPQTTMPPVRLTGEELQAVTRELGGRDARAAGS